MGSRRNRARQAAAVAAAQGGNTVAKFAPPSAVQAQVANHVHDPRDYAYEVIAQLARSSFAAISNPRRRRLRRGDGNYHCDYRTVEELRDISRWLEYHSGSYAGALHNWSQYLVGEGPCYTPMTKDKDWNRAAAALLADDFKNKRHDIRARFTWGKWLKLLATSIVRDGAMGVVHTATGPAQLIEAERVVAVDSNRIGQITSYTVAEVRNGFIDYSSKEQISPAMMDWCPVVTRVSQDLGIPLLFSTLDDHDGISDLWQAEITSASESARPWLTIEEKDNGLPGGMTIPQALGAANGSSPAQAPSARGDLPAGWVRTPNGNIMGLPKGLTGKVHAPERPNLDVPEFTKSVMRMACMMLLPYELLFGDQADISYSNGRSIRKLGNGLLNCFRKDYLEATITRIAHALLRQHIVHGRLPMPQDDDGKLAWQKGKWEWDEIPEHDRIKERQADTIDLANGTKTLKDLVGEDWQDVMEQRAEEYGKAAELVAAHNAAHPQQPITIHAILGDPSHTASLLVSIGASADQQAERKAGSVEPAPSGEKLEPAAS